jgi:hypothetical protein
MVLVDESNTVNGGSTLQPASDTPLRSWTLARGNKVFSLGAGSHTIRFIGRTRDARIRGFVLTPAAISASGGF